MTLSMFRSLTLIVREALRGLPRRCPENMGEQLKNSNEFPSCRHAADASEEQLKYGGGDSLDE